tara:strand:- start:3745 stop:5532 length:1788 start_codon:yes stop_codon:yes gene_type:complete
MAILFYDSISLDKQEIQDVSLQLITSAAQATTDAYQGRIIFTQDASSATTAGTLSYYNGSDWIDLNGVGAVISVTAGASGTTSSGQPLSVNPTDGAVVVTALEYGGGALEGYVPDGGGNSTTLFLNGAGGWSTPTGDYVSWNIAANTGTPSAVTTGDTVDLVGGDYISTAIATVGTTNTVTYTHDATARTNSSTPLSVAWGTSFDAITAITTNATGHFTDVETTTFTLPSYTDNDTTYTLPVGAGVANTATIVLTAGGTGTGGNSTVTFEGTANEIAITESPGANGNIYIGLPDDVTIASTLTVGGNTTIANTLDVTGTVVLTGAFAVTGVATFTAIPTMPTTLPVNNNQAANKAYVDSVLTGGVVFQGTYDASTVPGSPDLTSASSIVVEKGWAYTVDAPGTFFGEDVEIGDLLIANEDMASGASTLVKWSVLQNNVVEATATIFGIAKFTGGNGFQSAMTTAGEPKLADHSFSYTTTGNNVPTIATNSFGVVTGITNTLIDIPASQVSNFTAATKTVINSLRKSTLIPVIGSPTAPFSYAWTHGLDSPDLSVQVYEVTGGATVYPQIDRTSDTVVTFTFAIVPSHNAFRALIF